MTVRELFLITTMFDVDKLLVAVIKYYWKWMGY